jgi:hypothetical protein
MKILLTIYLLLSSISCFSQTKYTDGSSCENAIMISDSSYFILLPEAKNTTWYKFRAKSSSINIKFKKSGFQYYIYESIEGFCYTSEMPLFSLTDDSLNMTNENLSIITKAELNGLCSCVTCRKQYKLSFPIKLEPNKYYYIKISGPTNSFELNFEKDKIINTKIIGPKTPVSINATCLTGIIFWKTTSWSMGGQVSSDSLGLKGLPPLKYGSHIYYIHREAREFKVRDYVLDAIASKCALDSIVNYLTINNTKSITIIGHVSVGEDTLAKQYEQQASEALADIMRLYLIQNKIDYKRIETGGGGSTQMLFKDEKDQILNFYTITNKNNRVEIKLKDP